MPQERNESAPKQKTALHVKAINKRKRKKRV